jgi:transposase-like protein
MIDFPIDRLPDDRACYDWLVELLHPDGLRCPRCGGADALVHRYYRDPVLDYRCKGCGKVYNAFTGTDRQGTHFRPSQVVLILRGFTQGRSTAGLARELGCSRRHLLDRRHAMQARALAAAEAGATPLPDGTVEADEMDQNAGEKRGAARRPRGPAQAAGEQAVRARHLGQRPGAGGRGGGPRQRPAGPQGGAPADPQGAGR